jgi:hypothetical protein
MNDSRLASSNERIMETMVDLTRLSPSQRVIVAGASAFDIYRGLHQRGFSRAATIVTCRIPCGQHDAAFIAGEHSFQALQALLVRILPFLSTRATMAVWVGCEQPERGRKLQALLERLGFRIEAGARCESGFVLSAQRQAFNHIANAA